MKIKDLIAELQKYPEDMQVLGAWEGTIHDIRSIEPYDWPWKARPYFECMDGEKVNKMLLLDVE